MAAKLGKCKKNHFFLQKWPIYMLVQNISRGHEILKTFWNFGAPYCSPMSDIVFFDTHDISFDAIYRDIFTICSKCKLGQKAPKFHSWSAYVEIFATKWPTCGIFIRKHHTLGFFPLKCHKRVPDLGTKSL